VRSAYGGRAAAYAALGDYDRALADHDTALLLYGAEVEILNGLSAPGRDTFLLQAAKAYRARGDTRRAAGKVQLAAADLKRAADLEAEAKKVAAERPKENSPPASNLARLEFTNEWTEAVRVVVDGVDYQVEPGAKKAVPRPAGTVTFEVPVSQYRTTVNVEAGKDYRYRIVRPAP